MYYTKNISKKLLSHTTVASFIIFFSYGMQNKQ